MTKKWAKDNTEFKEIEVKYSAKDITLPDFISACTSVTPTFELIKQVGSPDHYYTNGDKFIRHREGESPELTMKEKTEKGNNFNRIECNLPISGKADRKIIDKFCSMLGFTRDFSIFKESTVILYPRFNTVYYVVYTDHTKAVELGRFIEIETDEHYPWTSSQEAWELILNVEQQLSALGLTSKSRLKKSLYEMFRT